MSDDNYDEAIPRICKFNSAIMMSLSGKTNGVFGDIRDRAPEVVKG